MIQQKSDFYSLLKWHLWQILLILLFVIALYKVIKVEMGDLWPF